MSDSILPVDNQSIPTSNLDQMQEDLTNAQNSYNQGNYSQVIQDIGDYDSRYSSYDHENAKLFRDSLNPL